MVYTLASQLITSCPSSNAALPVMAYPALTVTSPPADAMVASSAPPIFNGMPGATIPLNYVGNDSGSEQYAAIYSKLNSHCPWTRFLTPSLDGLGAVTVPIQDGSFTVPEGIQGYSFVLVTSSSDIAGVTCESWPCIGNCPTVDPLQPATSSLDPQRCRLRSTASRTILAS